MNQKNWWQKVFDQKYLDTYLKDLNPERTRDEVSFIIKAAQLKTTDRILDLACGHGRHSIELAKRGYTHVTGLDYSQVFISKAKADAKTAGVDVRFVKGDMKKLTFESEFDAILLIYTAFGYFDDETNKDVLRQINKSLRPSGRLFIDVISGEAVIERFNREGVLDADTGFTKVQRQAEMGGQLVDETEWFDKAEQVIHNHREWQDGGENKEYDYWLHVYTLAQYKQILADSGFKIIDTWGDNKGSAFGSEGAFRTIILAKNNYNTRAL